jgi:hypothetical protein
MVINLPVVQCMALDNTGYAAESQLEPNATMSFTYIFLSYNALNISQ